MAIRREWKGDEWQEFALQLVQRRHGAENVQVVPDKVKGDAGLEFFTTCGCLYQCYAPQEASDVAKAASAMKAKAGRDLPKLKKNQAIIEKLLAGTKGKRWILLCPFLDNKEVVASVRERGVTIRAENLPFLTSEFEALCHSQQDFLAEIEQLKALSLGPPLSVAPPTAEQVKDAAGNTEIGVRIDAKLGRAFGPNAPAVQVAARRDQYVKAHLHRENTLEQLRDNHAVLWERAFETIEAEEARLIAVGATSTIPGQQLQESMNRIESSLAEALPTLNPALRTRIALGTISDWLIRCPLDFPESDPS
ncbi:MAG: hypothetical protein IIZ38_05055 [Sphingomonas sp.]|uniref:hypothetical protein n=1 Tax=Sphingomonas sp. TaxID=28214 RepID=UPI0025F75D8C|nr:hypothetical protein [Sphingomonas sp.]MBQ1497664.1 hypothetical protein [Sphingomonas sp.]MBQ8102754.1 hypothetical protein [Afipia sp.]